MDIINGTVIQKYMKQKKIKFIMNQFQAYNDNIEVGTIGIDKLYTINICLLFKRKFVKCQIK